jgi:hypothetical protein
MADKYFLRGFADKTTEAVLVYLSSGIRIVNGTTQVFWDDIFSGSVCVPFVLETSDGDMAAGGVTADSPDIAKRYIISQVMSRVKRNHEKGLQSSVVPVFSGVVPNSLLTVSAIPAQTEMKTDLEDYALLEVFLNDWIKGYPGMFF